MKRKRSVVIGIAVVAVVVLIAVGTRYCQRQRSCFYLSQETGGNSELAARVGGLEGLLGFERWRFKFRLAPGYKLLATFHAEFNGKPYPEMSETYQLIPEWPSEPTAGDLWVCFYHPSFETKTPCDAKWTIDLHGTNKRNRLFSGRSCGFGNSFTHLSPFDPSVFTGPRGQGGSSSGAGSLEAGEEYEIWEHHKSGKGSVDDENAEYKFKYRLTIRMEEAKPEDKRGSVEKVQEGCS